jgi:predicted 2-oxoglutarate/Fe(II)-dependent dioxygenase YbiX
MRRRRRSKMRRLGRREWTEGRVDEQTSMAGVRKTRGTRMYHVDDDVVDDDEGSALILRGLNEVND